MKMYQTESGEFLRTQAEAKSSGEKFKQIDVPTDARGLVAYLNTVRAVESTPAPQPVPEKVDVSTSPYEKGAIHTVSEIADGLDTNTIVEAIMTCGSYTLGRYAMAVSLRYKAMNKRKKK